MRERDKGVERGGGLREIQRKREEKGEGANRKIEF